VKNYVFVFVKIIKIYWSIFIYYPNDVCTTSLNVNYNNQPLLLSLVAALKKKNRQINGA